MSNDIKLNSVIVESIFLDCLSNDDELKDNTQASEHVIAEGIINNFVFNTKRLESHAEEIVELISQLPIRLESVSFLNLCVDKNGSQWANEHRSMEQLVALGIASKKLSYAMPKDLWSICPGGVPYIGLEENRNEWDIFAGIDRKTADTPDKPQGQPGSGE